MNSASRHGCTFAGGDHLGSHDVALRILEIPGNYFAHKDAGSISQEVARPLHHRRTDQSAGKYIVEFGLLRRGVEPGIEMGAGFPEAYGWGGGRAKIISILRGGG